MGVVYDAEQESPKRRVALKVIKPPGHGRRAAVLQAFRGGAPRLLGRLHAATMPSRKVFDAGVIDEGDRAAAVLRDGARAQRYARSTSVRATSTDCPSTERDRVCSLMSEDRRLRVHHAHQKGVIHRDLKPHNVVIDDQGQPKVLDFGVARAVETDDAEESMLTAHGQILGTLPYMSPEQIAADPTDLDTRLDVFALGVMLYELLGEQLPLEVSVTDLLESIKRIKQTVPPLLGRVDPTFRGDLETIAAKAMEKSRDRRYGSAAALADDLRRYLNNEPIRARPPSSLYLVGKFVRRNRTLVAASILVLVSLVTGVVLALASAREEAHQRGRAEDRAQGRGGRGRTGEDAARAGGPGAGERTGFCRPGEEGARTRGRGAGQGRGAQQGNAPHGAHRVRARGVGPAAHVGAAARSRSGPGRRSSTTRTTATASRGWPRPASCARRCATVASASGSARSATRPS